MDRNRSVPISETVGAAASEPFETTASRMLTTALALHATNHPLSCREIKTLVCEVCANAKERGLAAERLIVELKHIWHTVPESATHDKAEVVSRLVSMCILEFYRTDPDQSVEG